MTSSCEAWNRLRSKGFSIPRDDLGSVAVLEILPVAFIEIGGLKTIAPAWRVFHKAGEDQSCVKFIVLARAEVYHPITLSKYPGKDRSARALASCSQNRIRKGSPISSEDCIL